MTPSTNPDQEMEKAMGFSTQEKHPSHNTRFSFDASTYDEVCVNCGATDIAGGGWGRLAKPCPKAKQGEPANV